jgi:flagellar FliJ protein
MPRFTFKLQGVLDYRQELESRRQKELAQAQAQMQAMQSELRQLNQEMQAQTGDLRQNHMVGPLSMDFLMSHRRFMLGMQQRAMVLVQRMALVQREIDQRRAALAQAAKERKIIEKLRDRHRERWLADQNTRERNELDEIGTRLALREQA